MWDGESQLSLNKIIRDYEDIYWQREGGGTIAQ